MIKYSNLIKQNRQTFRQGRQTSAEINGIMRVLHRDRNPDDPQHLIDSGPWYAIIVVLHSFIKWVVINYDVIYLTYFIHT